MPDEKSKAPARRKRKQPQETILSNYRDLPVARIRGNTWNPRSTGFNGRQFDELVASIKQKGVIQPIVVRPIQEQEYDFEIIAGERRHRAMSLIASKGPNRSTIPAVIRECGDEEAFEICFIENLQRQDLSEPEEALAFAEYVDRKGQYGVMVLAERLGISPRYVRKRVEIMRLPKPLIWAWQKEILQYGHLEQFLRLTDKKERLMTLKQIIGAWNDGEDIPTVRDFKQALDDAAADLGSALFDKSTCIACAKNSETQRNLFGIEDDHARCLDRPCYTSKQKEWLSENWKSHLKELDPGINTNGIRFSDEASHAECEPIYYRSVPEKCLSCESFVTLLNPSGNIRSHRACSGRKECRSKILNGRSSSNPAASTQKPLQGSDGTENENGTPVKSWHGEYFREEFFKTRIPEKAKELDPLDDKMVRLSLFAIVASNTYIHSWFAQRLDLPKKPRDTDYNFFLLCRDILPAIESLDIDQLHALLHDATIEVLLNARTVMTDTRRKVAKFLGINLAAEWRITKEYLEKKTKSEIVSIINRFKILDQPEAWKFASESCGLKLKSAIGRLKKEHMIGIIVDTGIDLTGIVPAEILYDSTTTEKEVFREEPPDSTDESPAEYEGDSGYTIDPEEEMASAMLI